MTRTSLKRIFGLALLAIIACSFSAFQPAKALRASGIKHDSIAPYFFVADTFMAQNGLQLKSDENPHMRVWYNPLKTSKYKTVNDIRIGFENHKAALKFFKKNLKGNSENGTEIHPSLVIPGISDLHVYKESDQMVKDNKVSGLNQRYYFFLFLVDYVYVKVFVATDTSTTVEEAAVFAKEAAKTMHLVFGK